MKISRKTLLKSLFGSLIAAPIFAKVGDNELLIDIYTNTRNYKDALIALDAIKNKTQNHCKKLNI